jgi:hypothetical protein
VLKSRKMRNEEAATPESTPLDIPTYKRETVIRIKPIETLNEYVLVMPFARNTTILLPNTMQYQPYGIVVGVSKNMLAPDGSRVVSALMPGDVIRFWERNVIDHDYKTPDPHYRERRLVLLSERSVLSRLPPVPFEIVDEPEQGGMVMPVIAAPESPALPIREEGGA